VAVSPREFKQSPRRAAQATRIIVPRFSRRGIDLATRLALTLRRIRVPIRDRWDACLTRVTVPHEAWRFGFGALIVLLLGLILALIAPAVPVTTPGVVLLVAVAFATWVTDWLGGITALVMATVILDIFSSATGTR
jgi:hypothetical protein